MVYDTSPLSHENILRDVHDPSSQTLRTTATAIIAPGLEVDIDHANDSVAIGTSTDLFTATTIGPDVGLDVNVIGGTVTGVLNPSGLSNALKASRMTITDVPSKVPASALSGRNTMSVRLLDDITVYFGNSSVNSSTGYPKFQYEEMVLDIQSNPSIDLWAVCASGQTCNIAILEIG